MAGTALRASAGVRSCEVGFQDQWGRGIAATAELGGVSGAAADRSDFRLSLRDAVEPAGQPLERRPFHRSTEAGTAEAGSEVCFGSRGGRVHRERAAGGFETAECAVC